MWKFLSGLFGGSQKQRPGGIGDVVKALDESDAARPLPTLVCRQCGLKYANTGTYLQGSRCPACYPNG
jgi:predicted Zn-ribbon and HTH transcriptional regulator